MPERYNVCVVGVGAVGIEMLRILRERNFPMGELRIFARSSREIEVDGQRYNVAAISPEGFEGIDIALFAGTEGEKGTAVAYAPEAIRRGVLVIDNGADFRMDPAVPLVVPEVNVKDINPVRNWFLRRLSGISNGVKEHKGLIANPNCSTIQMVVALAPIHSIAKIARVIVSSYQAASGAGRGAVEQLKEETQEAIQSFTVHRSPFTDGQPRENRRFSGTQSSEFRRNSRGRATDNGQRTVLPQRIAFNFFPQIGGFEEAGYTTEEWKMVKETRKIMHDDSIRITATCVRVATFTGHGEAIYIETEKKITADEARRVLSQSPGIKVIDEPDKSLYPLPVEAEGKDEVFVGRIRENPFDEKGLWLWVVSDNLRKGAALNAVQIAECVISS